ncbi:MAG: metallophosphoesterase family protein [Clostridia bacterium]|nr:metallophosphoesterase family protein [Clostridia bacterium]
MSVSKRISQIFESAERIFFDDLSKIVLISDCHRGNGNSTDNFLKNQHLYLAALTKYYSEDYIYIEIGDGDELWENKTAGEIIQAHRDIFELLSKFFNEKRLYFIYGNHDIIKKNNKIYQYFDDHEKRNVELFKNIQIHEGLVLKHMSRNCEILLIHGHQADFFNDKLWRLGRFLVRYLWKPLENFGVNDPTSAAKNYDKKEKIDKKLIDWAKEEKRMLIAGHTHRPMFPEAGEVLYFNAGSCVHPHCITAIEISEGCICLVKWDLKTKRDGSLFIGKDILAGPVRLGEFFY